MAWIVLLLAAVGALFGGVYLGQERLLFYPIRLSGESVMQAAEREGLTVWSPAKLYRGLVHNPDSDRGSIVVFHGNSGHAGDRRWYIQAFAPFGYRIILAEYPGYGARADKPTLQGLIDDSIETLRAARRIDPQAPLYVVGESLGAGIAAQVVPQLAAEVDGLMLITPWHSLAETASHHYPILPVSMLIKNRMDSAAALAGFRKPVVVIVAARDDVIPPAQGLALARDLNVPAELIDNAGHNDWRMHVDKAFWARVVGRMIGASGAAPASR